MTIKASGGKLEPEAPKEEEKEKISGIDNSLFGLDLLRLFRNDVSCYLDSWKISIYKYSLMNGFLLSSESTDTSELHDIQEYMRTPEMYYFVKSKKPKSWKSKWDYTGILEPEFEEIALVYDFFEYIFSFWKESPPTKEEVIEYMSSDAFYGYSTEEKKNKNDTSSDIQEF